MGAGAMLSAMAGLEANAQAGPGVVFELRIYHAFEGKLDDLLARSATTP